MQTMDLNIILNKKNSAAEMKIIFQISKFKTNVLNLVHGLSRNYDIFDFSY